MNNQPFLTIVTPTRGTFNDYWLEQLLKIKGNVQFLLVYPPGVSPKKIDDPRVEFLISPIKGEVMQRFTGLINAKGNYIIALDDDDFAHPDLLEITLKYFQRFPNSWVFRLKIQNVNYDDEPRIKQDWEPIPEVEQLEICKKTPENPYPFQKGNYKGLLEVPIAPLDKSLDIRHIIFPWKKRRDQEGIHFENFNNRVWKTELVKASLQELSEAMKIMGVLTWIPAWSLDRLLGLFVQAKFYQKDIIIGHASPKPEQIRYIVRDSSLKETRLYLMADLLLVKCYYQYGYLWNLIFWQIYTIPRIIGKSVKLRLLKSKQSKTSNTIAIES
jgi:glycosyltransferase involved in cell wall biosynthesis